MPASACGVYRYGVVYLESREDAKAYICQMSRSAELRKRLIASPYIIGTNNRRTLYKLTLNGLLVKSADNQLVKENEMLLPLHAVLLINMKGLIYLYKRIELKLPAICDLYSHPNFINIAAL